MVEIGTGKRSIPAMLLSLICPGLGQVYLRKPFKGVFLFCATALGVILVYFNSLPVDSIGDLLLVGYEGNQKDGLGLMLENPESDGYEYTISVILKSSDYKTVAEEIGKLSSVDLFGYTVLLVFTNSDVFEETENYKAIRRFEKRELKFRPIWPFRVSGTFQVLFIWGYSIWDGYLGYKGYKRKKKKEEDE